MIPHYLKFALRHLFKNRYYTLINVFGLVFGMGSALIIAKYIGGSLQMDSFHQQRDSIYTVSQEETIQGNPQKASPVNYWGLGELINRYPEVLNATRYSYHVGSLVIAADQSQRKPFFENRIFNVDSSFLDIFSFPLIHGNPASALSVANSIVLTRSTSQRHFDDSNPVGKTLTIRVPWGSETVYTVTGVLKDVPKRSQFQFDFLITQHPRDPGEYWLVPDCSTFLLLKEDAEPRELAAKLSKALSDLPPLQSTHRTVTVSLDSLAAIQLSKTGYLLIAVGIFIILISWVNYINQVIAQSFRRMKEMGILRVIGASGFKLRAQFVVEASLICLTSALLIIAVYKVLEPTLQSLTNGHLLPLFKDPTGINIGFFAIFGIGILLAAAIPVAVFFSQDLNASIRHSYTSKIGGIGLRKALVVVQFSISALLIISVFVISKQLDYMSHKDKGIDMQDVFIIQAPIAKDTSWQVKRKSVALFKEKCEELPYVRMAASSTTVPGEEYRWETYISLQGNNNQSMVHQNGVDGKFFDLYNVEFIAGSNFIPDARWKNRNSIILNKSAARALGLIDFNELENTKIIDHESNEVYELIGIVNDYHQTSLRNEMQPIAFKFNDFRGHFSLKMERCGLPAIEWEERLGSLRQIWEQTYPDASISHFFLDQQFAAQDSEDRYFGQLFKFFTILSICISCLGLFGLSLLISTQRQREIGIRKVFGASSLAILTTLLKSYLQPIALAMAIGTPVALQLMKIWLSNFAYRIEMGWEVVSLALLSLTLIFLLTVAYHTINSSISNPVTILRD